MTRWMLAIALCVSTLACHWTDAAAVTATSAGAFIALLQEREALTPEEAQRFLATLQELEAAAQNGVSREELGIGAAGILAATLEVWRRKRRQAVKSLPPAEKAPAKA